MLDWSKYISVANRYQYKAKPEDREDLNHNIIIALAEAQKSKDNDGGSQLSEIAIMRIASYQVADYWREQYKFNNGLDCGSCGKKQRHICQNDDLYSECPKAIRVEYLSKPVIDGEGNLTELGELIADDKAIDLEAWIDDKTFILGCPKRLIAIAVKRRNGISIDGKDREYLSQYRQREQKHLALT